MDGLIILETWLSHVQEEKAEDEITPPFHK